MNDHQNVISETQKSPQYNSVKYMKVDVLPEWKSGSILTLTAPKNPRFNLIDSQLRDLHIEIPKNVGTCMYITYTEDEDTGQCFVCPDWDSIQQNDSKENYPLLSAPIVVPQSCVLQKNTVAFFTWRCFGSFCCLL